MQRLYHILPETISAEPPSLFPSPYSAEPHPLARAAAEEVIDQIHKYMDNTPQSELHRLGKMFGVLVIGDENGRFGYLKAFSSLLDGQHEIEGFVPPIFDFADKRGYFRQEEARISTITAQLKFLATNGKDSLQQKIEMQQLRKAKSQALQRWLFSQYHIMSASGQMRDLTDIFAHETPILSAEEYFSGKREKPAASLPPSGAGECCAPKLLQFAFSNRLKPLALAEFWIGAAPANEMRRDSYFYGACQGKCRPILKHMLQGIETADSSEPKYREEDVRILMEDEWLIAVLKPAGMLTTAGKTECISLEQFLREKNANPSVHAVHRLDQDTSGIVIFAKTEEAYCRMQALFRTRQVFKRYEAIVEESEKSAILSEEGEINLPLLPDPYDRPRQMVDYEHGKDACTKYKIRSRGAENRVFIDLFPLTGRTHQLRVHCAHPKGLNAPIVGDRLYGKAAERLYLHAAELQFVHPYTSKTVHLQVSL